MATEFYEYSNVRLLIGKPAAVVNFRDGVPSSTAAWLIHVYAKGPTGGAAELPSIDPKTRVMGGYITAWAEVPAATAITAASSGFTWNDTGLAPDGLRVGMGGRGLIAKLEDLPLLTGPALQGEVSITMLSDPFGPGGIGSQIRELIGDKISIELQVAG
jgi:hypothetical protein